FRLDDPWQVGSLDASSANRAGDAEGRDVGFVTGGLQKLHHDLVQPARFFAGIDRLGHEFRLPICDFQEGETAVGAAYVSGENHFSKFLQRRPSFSINSSASFGPQDPAA